MNEEMQKPSVGSPMLLSSSTNNSLARFTMQSFAQTVTRAQSPIPSKKSKAVEANAQGVGKVELGLADWLVKVAPFLQTKASVEAGAGVKRSTSDVSTESVTVTPIDNPYRQLIQLTVHYLANYQDRLLYATKATIDDEISNMSNGELPKALVFLDLPSKADALKAGESPTMIIPMAGEFSNGTIKLMFEQYMLDVMDLKRPAYLSWSKDMDSNAY